MTKGVFETDVEVLMENVGTEKKNNLHGDDQKLSPMMKQYYALRESCPEYILFFRMGDFYELFGEQAELVAPKLDIILTSREKGGNRKIAFCGVPHHSAQSYWLRLIKLGYKVAVAEQVEEADPKKGLVERKITRYLTPGCIDELEGLASDQPNYMMALYECPESRVWTILLADTSTGELRIGEVGSFQEVREYFSIKEPRELLVRKFSHELIKAQLVEWGCEKTLTAELSESVLRNEEEQKAIITQSMQSWQLTEQQCKKVKNGLLLLASFFDYLKKLNAETKQFYQVLPLLDPDSISLSDIAIRDLELFQTVYAGERKNSLFAHINYTKTPMGARKLRFALTQPLYNIEKIKNIQNGVFHIHDWPDQYLDHVGNILGQISDIERIFSRILAKKVRPLELVRFHASVRKIVELAEILTEQQPHPALQEVLAKLQDLKELDSFLGKAISENYSHDNQDLDFFRAGYDEQFDQLRYFSRNGEKAVDEYLACLKEQVGINNLKVKNHKTFGLLIEVTKSNLKNVPDFFIRKQTMVNCERYLTMELKELDEQLSSAFDQALSEEQKVYERLLDDITQYDYAIRQASEKIATFDYWYALAVLAKKHHYCRPQFDVQGNTLELKAARHPVVERNIGLENYIANNVFLNRTKRKQLLITGPNMAGKSTVMRQIALSVILAQMGGGVPAQAATLPLFDGIFTRVGASDDLSKGLSTFMVEMTEAAIILKNATKNSLIILDEVGRGTSTEDGLAIASSILSYISQHIKAWMVFATHYHELVEDAKNLTSVDLAQIEVLQKNGKIHFTHKLIAGSSGSSYGIEVAELAGLPSKVVEEARNYLKNSQHYSQKQIAVQKNLAQMSQASEKEFKRQASIQKNLNGYLFTAEDHGQESIDTNKIKLLSNRLDKIHINRTTPLQALKILDELKSEWDRSEENQLFEFK